MSPSRPARGRTPHEKLNKKVTRTTTSPAPLAASTADSKTADCDACRRPGHTRRPPQSHENSRSCDPLRRSSDEILPVHFNRIFQSILSANTQKSYSNPTFNNKTITTGLARWVAMPGDRRSALGGTPRRQRVAPPGLLPVLSQDELFEIVGDATWSSVTTMRSRRSQNPMPTMHWGRAAASSGALARRAN